MKGFKVAGANASVSVLDFCPRTFGLAIGNECGLVSLLQLGMSSKFPIFLWTISTYPFFLCLFVGSSIQAKWKFRRDDFALCDKS